MQIRSCEAQLLQIPLERPVVSGMSSGDRKFGCHEMVKVVFVVVNQGACHLKLTQAVFRGNFPSTGCGDKPDVSWLAEKIADPVTQFLRLKQSPE